MGCRVCRARKVKCDGRPNGCRNCERLQLDCVGDDGSATKKSTSAATVNNNDNKSSPAAESNGETSLSRISHQAGDASLRKIRTYRSCTSCRLSKTKCNGDRPKCARCKAKGGDCVYDGGAVPRWARNLSQGAPSSPPSASVSVTYEKKRERQEDSEEQQHKSPARRVDRSEDIASKRKRSVLADQSPAAPERTSQVDGLFGSSERDDSATVDEDSSSWLVSPKLPSARNLRRVVETYFNNLHPLRCFAFVHKPSFMRQLDQGFDSDDGSALLHIMCAHGAKFHVLSLSQGGGEAPSPTLVRAAGNQWARKAEYLVLSSFGKISVERLMAAVLLHDFHFRMGEFNQALMISGLAVRMAHALKINTEYSSDIMCTEVDTHSESYSSEDHHRHHQFHDQQHHGSTTNVKPDTGAHSPSSIVARESRRRLMWACYVLDAWTGSGVDQLTLLRETDIMIQLPCNERNFGLRIPSVTETLGVGHVLQFLPPAVVPRRPAANMGIMAYYIRIVTLWKRIVRYVNHLDNTAGPPPWEPESEFAALDADLQFWRRELPEFVEYSTETIYARLDSNQLGSLVLIHCTYHHNFLELYKFSMPDLFKLHDHHRRKTVGINPFPVASSIPVNFSTVPPEHREFVRVVQANAYHHARRIADIIAEAAEHGARLLSDSLLPFFIYDSSRVMLYYVARLLDPGRADVDREVRETILAVESNARVLRMVSPLFPVAESLSSTIERWLLKIRRTIDGPPSADVSTRGDDELASQRRDLDITPNASNTSSPHSAQHSLPHSNTHLHPPDNRHDAGRAAHLRSGGGRWDHTSAAQQLVGLSQEPRHRPSEGLQHERPVPRPPPRPAVASDSGGADNDATHAHAVDHPIGEGLDLDDLQNFLSWDMYGFMEMSDAVSNLGRENDVVRDWLAKR